VEGKVVSFTKTVQFNATPFIVKTVLFYNIHYIFSPIRLSSGEDVTKIC